MITFPPRGSRRHLHARVPQAKLLQWGTAALSRAGRGPHEARILLEWALNVDTLLRAPSAVGMRAAERYRSAIRQRTRGFPLQHITGSMQFRQLELVAGPGVFSVRPETELIIEAAQAELSAGGQVADLCAGSGAIGLAVATEFPHTTVTAVELSALAAGYARRNHDRHRKNFAAQSSWTLVEGDALRTSDLAADTFDVILTNPPYVPGQPPLHGDVLFDPEMALYGGGEDGMVVPRGLVPRSWNLLKTGGTLLMEHDPQQAQMLVDLAEEGGFSSAETVEDLNGRPRFLKARK